MSRRAFVFFFFLGLPLLAMDEQSFSATIPFNQGTITVFSNHALDAKNENIDRIIVALHGNKRDAKGRLAAAVASAKDFTNRALIISPHFKTDKDACQPQDMYWRNSGWKQGDKSKDRSRTSSFDVLDHIIKKIISSRAFPNIKKIFITGHSAGGQFTQRYALTTRITDDLPEFQFSFLVLNPSSYTYLNKVRPRGERGQFVLINDEPSFNHYKYGLDKLNAYAATLDASLLRDQYVKRRVYYILGQEDNDPKHDELDVTPAAMAQGRERLSRGRNFFENLTFFYQHAHALIEIPGVGHDAEKMYGDDAVRGILFE